MQLTPLKHYSSAAITAEASRRAAPPPAAAASDGGGAAGDVGFRYGRRAAPVLNTSCCYIYLPVHLLFVRLTRWPVDRDELYLSLAPGRYDWGEIALRARWCNYLPHRGVAFLTFYCGLFPRGWQR